MADFTSDFQSFKQSFSFLDMESLTQFTELNPCLIDNSAMNYQSFLSSSIDNFFGNQAQAIPGHSGGNLQSPASVFQPLLTAKTELVHESKKRKALDASKSTSFGNSLSSPQVSETEVERRNVNIHVILSKLFLSSFSFSCFWVLISIRLLDWYAGFRKREKSKT